MAAGDFGLAAGPAERSQESDRHHVREAVGDGASQAPVPAQYEVTQHDGTEPPFRNAFWDNHEAGIYVDIVSGEPLFSSRDKFDSGTGWPSFTRPVEPERVVEHE